MQYCRQAVILNLFLDTLCWGRNPNLLNLRIPPVQSKIAPLISLTLNSQRRSSTVRFRSLIATLKLHSGLGMAPVGISRQCARLSYVAIIRLACGSTPRAIASACAFRLLRRSTAQASKVWSVRECLGLLRARNPQRACSQWAFTSLHAPQNPPNP